MVNFADDLYFHGIRTGELSTINSGGSGGGGNGGGSGGGGNNTLTAAFTWVQTGGCAGASVAFTDTSTGNPTSWLWDFGGGNTSTLQNPTILLADNITATLTVTGPSGSDTVSHAITKQAGFTGYYRIDNIGQPGCNWLKLPDRETPAYTGTESVDPITGALTFTTGANGQIGISYLIPADKTGTLTFDWTFTDTQSLYQDHRFGYFVNGDTVDPDINVIELASNVWGPYSGTVSVQVGAGDLMGFHLFSDPGTTNTASATISCINITAFNPCLDGLSAGFVGDYSAANWQTSGDGGQYVVTQAEMDIVGAESLIGSQHYIVYTTMQNSGAFSADYVFYDNDIDNNSSNQFGYYLNGTIHALITGNSSGGNLSLILNSGDVIGFYVYVNNTAVGNAPWAQITNFSGVCVS